MLGMMTSFSMIFLNESGAIGVALPQMQQALELTNNNLNWIMNAFLLTAATLLLFGGKLADHHGRKKIYLIGLVIFIIASALVGASTSGWMIISCRVLQAIGASLVYPSGTALIARVFPQQEFAKAYGTIIGASYLFVAFGPLVGGIFTDFLNWRWLFWINVPLGLICFALLFFSIPADVIEKSVKKIDFKGLIIFMVSLGALVYALMEGEQLGWHSKTILSLFLLFIIGISLFIFVELKTADPLLEVRLFRNKRFIAGNITFPSTAACFTALIFWAIWLQQTFNYSPVLTGVAMIPATALSIVLLRVTGAWGDRVGVFKPLLIGSLLLIAGVYWIAITALFENYFLLFWGFLLFGIATPMIIPNSIKIILNSVEPKFLGIASGVYLTLQHVAFTLGFAILAAVIGTYNTHHLNLLLTQKYPDISLAQVHLLLAGKNTTHLSMENLSTLKTSAIHIYTHAFSYGMAIIGIFPLVILLTTLFLIRSPIIKSSGK